MKCAHFIAQFAGFWRSVLWANETKLLRMAEKQDEAFNPKSTIPTVRHGGGSIVLSECLTGKRETDELSRYCNNSRLWSESEASLPAGQWCTVSNPSKAVTKWSVGTAKTSCLKLVES